MHGDEGAIMFVTLADHTGTLRQLVEGITDEELDKGPLLLNHNNLFEPVGKLLHNLRLEGEDHAKFQDSNPVALQSGIVEAETSESLAQLIVGLTRGNKPDTCTGSLDGDTVEPIGAGKGKCGNESTLMDLLLEGQARWRTEGMGLRRLPGSAVEGQVGKHDRETILTNERRPKLIGNRGDHFEPNPEPREARELKTEPSIVEQILDIARYHHRHQCVVEGCLRGRGECRRLRKGIITGNGKNTAVATAPSEVGMLEDIAATINPRCLAIPHADHPIVGWLWEEVGNLATKDHRCAEILVDARDEAEIVGVEEFLATLEEQIKPSERRTAVARD